MNTLATQGEAAYSIVMKARIPAGTPAYTPANKPARIPARNRISAKRTTPAEPRHHPAVDAYLDAVKPFATPILLHLRGLIHQACPQVQESMKWSRPFFSYRGAILCNISAFSQHCSFGFWGEEMGTILQDADALRPGAMGSLGRIRSLADLPDDAHMLSWLRQATALIEEGKHTSPITARQQVVKAPRPSPETPEDFLKALQRNQQAAGLFEALSPSCRREYLEWIASAKREATRATRIEAAVAWIAEGKQRNWKYQAG